MSAFTLGQPVSYAHPAGRVQGTVIKVEQRAVLVHIHRAADMPRLEMWFTLRGDGTHRQSGKGPKSPVLEVRK